MSQALSLNRSLLLIALLLIDLAHISLVSSAMRIYPTYAAPAAWSQQQTRQTGARYSAQQRQLTAAATPANVATATSRQGNINAYNWQGVGSRKHQMLDPPHSDAIFHINAKCHSSPASSTLPHGADCSRSPAPTEAEGSEIDPRYGVEKRLVPTGPNPLHN